MTITKHILLESRKSINGLGVSDNLGRMSWGDAKIACKKLGAGWRLPTKDELNMLYQNKEEVGGFASTTYWSSTEVDSFFVWLQYFGYGNQSINFKYLTYCVRAVRAS